MLIMTSASQNNNNNKYHRTLKELIKYSPFWIIMIPKTLFILSFMLGMKNNDRILALKALQININAWKDDLCQNEIRFVWK